MAERIPVHLRDSSKLNADRAPKAEERILAELAVEGLVTPAEGALTPFKPLRVAGKPLSETLLEDRKDRL
jgi:hypothetical protein